jgi:7,8-dihydro-6-hydroxymethylpterin-pyrophosphokinase
MSEKDKLAMLNAIPDKPRFMVFVLRSYTGSRQHLLIAAREMLTASALDGDPKKSGATFEVHQMKAAGQLPEHALGAVSFKNALSIQQALDIAASVERKLEDPKKPGARETVRIDLIWVQGVKMKTPGLELPSPEIAGNGYLAFYFEESIHSMGLEAFPDKGERDHMVKTIKNAPDIQEGGWAMRFNLKESLAFYRKPDHNEWTDSGPDKAEILAITGCAVGAAVIERVRARGTVEKPVDPSVAKEMTEVDPQSWSEAADRENHYGVERGTTAVEERRRIALSKVLSIDIAVDPKAKDEALVTRWASEVQSVTRQNWLRLGHVVIFALEPGRIRGAILGQESDKPVPGVELLGARVKYDPERGLNSPDRGDNYYDVYLKTGQLFDQGSGDQ